MERGRPTRSSAASIRLETNLRCQRIYPTPSSPRTLGTLKAVGILLTRDQAIHLARILFAVTQDWGEVDITGYRFEQRRSDGTFRLTVTSCRAGRQDQRPQRRPPGTADHGRFREWEMRVGDTDYCIINSGETWTLLFYDPAIRDWYSNFDDVDTFLMTHNLLLTA